MKALVEHPQYGQIVYEEGALSGKKDLFVNDRKLSHVDKASFLWNAEQKQIAYIKGSYLSGAKLTIGQEEIELTPKATWYEWAFTVIMVALVIAWGNSAALCAIVPVVGGAIGGLISGAMAVANFALMKKQKNFGMKLLIWLGMMAANFGLCALVAQVMLMLMAAAL